MSAAPSRSAEQLTQIAAMLRVPVEHFSAPPREPTEAERSPSVQVAALLLDPQGARLAAAFVALPAHARASLANVAEALASVAKDAA